MLSFICLSLFIVLVYVSGSTINNTETSSISLYKDNRKQSINLTTLAINTITTPSSTSSTSPSSSSLSSSSSSSVTKTIELSTTISNIIDHEKYYFSHQPTKSFSTLFHPTKVTTTKTTISTTFTNIESPSTFISLTSTEVKKTNNNDDNDDVFVSNNPGYLNITSQAGTHAYLPCNVKQLVDKPVSWIRVRDGHILTVGYTTFINDDRFQSIYTQNPERWSLQIKYVQMRDAGSYECQVSTEPKMSTRVQLNIIEPKTELLGESNRHVKAGSPVILRCVVSGGLEPPLFINWLFNKNQINLHNKNRWKIELNRDVLNLNENSNNQNDKQNTISSLIIPSVTKKDSGNYTCSPSNSESITIVLHVLNGYSASAITSGCDVLFHHHDQQFYFNVIECNWIQILCFIILCLIFKS